MGAGFVGKQVGHAYDVIKKHVPKGIIKSNPKEGKDMNKEQPPNLEENQNNVMESGRPLHAGDEVKEENVEAQKEENQKQQKTKIIMKKKSIFKFNKNIYN